MATVCDLCVQEMRHRIVLADFRPAPGTATAGQVLCLGDMLFIQLPRTAGGTMFGKSELRMSP